MSDIAGSEEYGVPQPSKIRVAAIGAGYFSDYQFEAWNRIDEVNFVALSNRTKSKADAKAERYGIPRSYGDWREMIDREKPDVVDIITPPETHLEICRYAAGRGVHIICQKPLAPTYEEAEQIVRVASDGGVRFMVHENFRWQPWYREIKRVQRAGTIGEFHHVHTRMRTGDGWGEDAYLARQPFFRDYPRLLIYETGVHFIDTYRFLLGEIVEVFARLRRLNPLIRGEDTGVVFLRFASGATALWDAGRYNEAEAENPRYTFGRTRIDATGGHLVLEMDSTLRLKPLGRPGYDVEYERQDVNFAGDCCYFTQRHFVDRFLDGGAFESCGEDYLRTVRAVDACYESAESGATVLLT